MASPSSRISDEESEEFLNDDKVVSLVNLLNKHKVKLWELPNLETTSNCINEDLLMQLSDESGLGETEVKDILVKLQRHSIRKLESNQRFTKDGIAAFTLKIIGNDNKIREKSFKDQIEVQIDISGRVFKETIMEKFQLNCDNLKLIMNGKLIKDEQNLIEQDVKNNSVIIAMCVYEKLSYEAVNKNNEDFKLISDIKEAVSLLTDNVVEQKPELNQLMLQNQNGLSLDLSRNDQKFLTSAMILHEKGKTFIKAKEYLKAIILLAEADNQFKNCSDRNLLEKVDNYAILNLEIVWCYLCLQNLNDLKNAEERLSVCEKSLEKCYGANLERLTLIEHENSNKYRPIFIRLNLLKGILMYHKGKKMESKRFLDAANSELQKNVVDEEKVVQVMSMGFTNTQARLALRVTGGNVDAAIENIIKVTQQKKEAKQLEKERAYGKKLLEKYGQTLNSKPINVKILKDILQFGYTEKRAAIALIQANNDFNLALDILQSQSLSVDFDDVAEPATTSSASAISKEVNDAAITQLMSMGFDLELCKLCLSHFNENIQKSIEYLLSKSNDLKLDPNAIKAELSKLLNKATASSGIVDEETENKKRNAEELLASLVKDIPEDDEAYLDLNLDEDSFYINKYFSLLGL